MNLLILGASGGCGKWLIRLAQERGHHVRALVRPATPFDLPAGVEVIRGDVLDRDTLDDAVEGRDAILSALGIKRKNPLNPWSPLASPPDLTTRVAEHLVALLPRHGIRRLIAVSAGGVGESIAQVNPLLRWMIGHSNMAASYADLATMETVLAQSELHWTAMRPTTLTPGPPTGDAQVVDQYGLLTRISRGDVAAWMLDALEEAVPSAGRTPMIASRGSGNANLSAHR